MKRLGSVLVVFLLVQAGLAVAAPRLGLELDPSFGNGGVVVLEPGVPGYQSTFPEQMAGTRTGGFFVLEDAQSHACGGCSDWYLVRYGRTGARDRGFGFRPVVLRSREGDLRLAVDATGRPLITWKEGEDVVLGRFTHRGSADTSFGKGGRFVFRCGCFPDTLVSAPDGKVVLVADPSNKTSRRYKGSIPVVLRLRENGTRDRSFGGDGIVRPRLHGRYSPNLVATAPQGGILLSDSYCCGFGHEPYVVRLREDGKIDRRFGRQASRAMRRLPPGESQVFTEDMVVHPDGDIDVFGGLDFDRKAFALRLNPDGSRDSSFGHGGMRTLPWRLFAAAADGRDGTILDVYQHYGDVLYRVGPDLKVHGAPHLRLYIGEEEGAPIEAQPKGRIFVFDRGLGFCRQACQAIPRVDRLRLRSRGAVR
jgi:uncharacterized delta-60 repeat protein